MEGRVNREVFMELLAKYKAVKADMEWRFALNKMEAMEEIAREIEDIKKRADE